MRPPKIQYHSSPLKRLDSILTKGVQLPRHEQDVTTFQHSAIPTISTADEFKYAEVYNPSGVVFELLVDPQSKWTRRTIRNMRKRENLVDAVARWVREASEKGYDAIYVEGMQSTVGNQVLTPDILTVRDYTILSRTANIVKYKGRTYRQASLDDLKEIFGRLASQQRGLPEQAMLHVQETCGGVINPVVEHVGDLIHRMTERTTFASAGYEYVQDKVEKCLYWLSDGFEREFHANIKNNARFDGVSYEDRLKQCQQSLRKYAEEHSQLQPLNRAQALAQFAAVSLGYEKFDSCVWALLELEKHLVNEDQWVKFAHQYDPNAVNEVRKEQDKLDQMVDDLIHF